MRILKNLVWMIAAGPIMVVTTLVVLAVGALYLVLGLIAVCFFFWMCFWGVHWLYSHEVQSALYCAEAFGVCATVASLISLMTLGFGSGAKAVVTGPASRNAEEPEHPQDRRRRRIHVPVPVLRPKRATPTLRVVN